MFSPDVMAVPNVATHPRFEVDCVERGQRGKGPPIGERDTEIAAHALILGVTLVTNNERDFSQVAGLQLEAWL